MPFEKKKSIPFIVICILILSFATASSLKAEYKSTKPTHISTLSVNEISEENKTKLMGFYGRKFSEIKQVNNYKQHKNITIINVTLGNNKYARVVTNTGIYNNILK